MNPKIDALFRDEKRWHKEFGLLRELCLSCGLEEQLKWGQACYSAEGRNIVLIHGFKDYCALLFFKGALMKDQAGLLVRQTGNVQSARQIRFTTPDEIMSRENVLRDYIEDAKVIEKSGAKVAMKTTADFEMVKEFKAALARSPALKKAFVALTPGRQRGYLLHFASAKQSSTRQSRIEKATPAILAGKGLQDE